ncbi:endonuclease [Aestuariivivens marinum]|uniref:endonuclease n=1 Tax=Aestuariivivens marinum TaxID=2913555 RepID=UPI001F5955A8|nr:endonuclease [Aestuariivivens marinum]
MKHLYFLFLFISITCFGQLEPPAELQDYYSGIDFSETGLTLKTSLSNLTINKHTNILSYGWDAIQATDQNPSNASNVLLIYGWEDGSDSDCTNDLERNINLNGGSNCDYNREHIYAKSKATPAMDNTGPGADGHHIRASDVQRNGERDNLPFADGTGNSGKVNSNTNWYPGDNWKGDVARVIMYMYIRYENQCLPTNIGVGSSASTPDDMIDLFLEWNAEDPVSSYEDNRNAYHVSENTYAQGNRNPFIDNPYLATLIWGGPVAENRWSSLGVTDKSIVNIRMHPNPTTHNLVYFTTTEKLEVVVYNLLGKKIMSHTINNSKNFIDISILSKGVYLVKLNSNEVSITKKLIIQ